MRAAKSVEKRIETIQNKQEIPFIAKERRITLPIRHECASRLVLQVTELSKSFGDQLLFHDLSIQLMRGERLAILGTNGCGKSTLLRLLAGLERADRGQVSWSKSAEVAYFFHDEIPWNQSETVLQTIWNDEQHHQLQARTILGALGIKADKLHQSVASLSPGERSKVSIAKVAMSGANVLALDEPTNHLELNGRRMLEDALASYQGTIIMVSHDQRFLDRLATRTLCLKKSQIL